MPRLHLPSDEFTIPVRCPNLPMSLRCPYDVQITLSVWPLQGDPAIIVRIYWYLSLYDFI